MSDSIFLKYANQTGFPFEDWRENSGQLAALHSFWSDVFTADVLGAQSDFQPIMEAAYLHSIREPGIVFYVLALNGCRGLRVTHLPRIKGRNSGFFVTGRYDEFCDPIPDSFILDVATDLHKPRIEAIRTLIRQQFGGDATRSLKVRQQELDRFIDKHTRLFPGMAKSLASARELGLTDSRRSEKSH